MTPGAADRRDAGELVLDLRLLKEIAASQAQQEETGGVIDEDDGKEKSIEMIEPIYRERRRPPTE